MQTASNLNILLRLRPFVSDSQYRWYFYRKVPSAAASVIGHKIIRFTMSRVLFYLPYFFFCFGYSIVFVAYLHEARQWQTGNEPAYVTFDGADILRHPFGQIYSIIMLLYLLLSFIF